MSHELNEYFDNIEIRGSKVKDNNSKKPNNKKKKLVTRISALALAIIAGVGSFVALHSSKKNNNGNKINTVVSTIDSIGDDLEYDTTTTKYNDPSGKLDVSKIVKDSKGRLYVNEEALKKAGSVGSTSIDTKNGTLVTKSNGKVYVKDEGYTILDKDGNVKATGTKPAGSNVPDGYVWDSNRNEYVKKEDAGKYIYNKNGELVRIEDKDKEEGEKIISSETKIVENTTTTTTPSTSTTTKSNQTTTTTTKPSTDKYYTDPISELKFESKEDYQQWVLNGYKGYGLVNGVMVAKTKEMEKADQEYQQKQKTLTKQTN